MQVPPMNTRKRTLLSDERGAMFAETLVMVPLLIVLWILSTFLARGNSIDHDAVEDSRYCAWRYAVDECEGGPARNCSISGPTEVPGPELDGAARGALTIMASTLRFLAAEWMRPHGRVFTTTTTGTLSRPFGWGSIDVETHHTWMCQTPEGIWTPELVWLGTCAEKGLVYCP